MWFWVIVIAFKLVQLLELILMEKEEQQKGRWLAAVWLPVASDE